MRAMTLPSMAILVFLVTLAMTAASTLTEGFMHQCFEMAALWGERCSDLRTQTLPGAHFFVDQFPKETAAILLDFLPG